MDSISELLGEGTLPKELAASLQEAFDKKVEAVREQAEIDLREEFARRYEHDKGNLVEAIDRMLSDVVERHEREKNEAVQRFTEARGQFRRAVKESRRKFRGKLDETVKLSRSFVTSQLVKEIKTLRQQKQSVVNEGLKHADKFAKLREQLKLVYAKRLRKIDEFVVRQVRKELTEFAVDHKALVETRVKLVAQARRKLRETQMRFVKQAAHTVEQAIDSSLKRELGQLHEDLERNRQNMFGRRIFEAVAAEYMTSYLAEGTEIRALQKVLSQREAELSETKAQLGNVLNESAVAARKAKLAEERATRTRVMSELLGNLRGEKRVVMEGMLETTRTAALRETFNKLLPVVIDNATRTAQAPVPFAKKPLTETRTSERRGAVVTGNLRRPMFEANAAENTENDNDIAQVLRLAGIVTK